MMWNYGKPPDKTERTVAQILKYLYSFYLNDKDSAKHYLIERYWMILPYKFIREYNELEKKGQNQENPWMKDLIFKSNPLLKLIPKNENFQGKYPQVPLIYGKKDE